MKKIILLFTGLLIVSCSNEELGNSDTKSGLVSIRENRYMNNQLTTYKTLNFSDDKLITIDYYDDRDYDEYAYNDQGLVSKIIEHQAPGGVYMITTYLYDEKGRIIEFNKIPGPLYSFPEKGKYEFTYLSDKIILTTTYDAAKPEKVEISLNASNNITKRTIFYDAYSYNYTYENGNLTDNSLFYKNKFLTGDYTKYVYSNLKNEYNYKKFIFGKEWKLNSYINGIYLNTPDLTDLSENLVSEYMTSSVDQINPADYTYILTSKYKYVFNDKNQMEKQTISCKTVINGIPSANMTTYELLYTYK
jgi:hypothetical protein